MASASVDGIDLTNAKRSRETLQDSCWNWGSIIRVKNDTDNRDLYSGMTRLHILHHAEHEAIFGAGMAEELARHGYKISPGTLYPILHGLEKRGYLRSEEKRSGRSARRLYKITASGRRALKTAKLRVRELLDPMKFAKVHRLPNNLAQQFENHWNDRY